MTGHYVGQPYPIPSFNFSSTNGPSLAAHQFLALARGEVAVQAPANDFRVEAVRAEEHYCLKCLVVRWFDVVYGWELGVDGCQIRLKRCRHCGRESVA